MAIKITFKQKQVLGFIDEFIRQKHYSPTLREICEYFDWRGTKSAADHIRALKRKGYIDFVENKARTIRIIKEVEVE